MIATRRGAAGAGTAPEGSASQVRQALTLLRDAIGDRAGRFGLIVALSVLAAALESLALVLLPALLGAGPGAGSGPGLLAADAVGLAGVPAFYLALVGLTSILLYAQAVAANRLTLDFGEHLRTRLHAAVMRAGWGTPALSRPADIVHALTAEAMQCAHATQVAIDLATRLIYLPSLMAAALFLSPRLALAAVALATVAGLPMLPLARRAYALSGSLARAAMRLHAEISDALAGLKALKVLRAEAARGDALRGLLREVRDAQLAQTRASAAVRAWQRFAAATAAVAGAVYGLSVLHLDGAAMLALALALGRLASSLSQTLEAWRRLARLLPVYGHFRAREDACRAAAEREPAAEAPRLRHCLHLRGVAFTHPGAEGPALSGIELTIPARAITALTGPSGAGKSTLADVVMGLVAPTEGEMAIDGVRLDDPARVAWRGRVAYVAQEPFLFHDTIRANLRLARPGAGDADLEGALEAAAATFALRLPQGLDTVVGERGSRLSGGERQRLMFARALLSAPDLLVLDEATNALDPVSEAQVIASMRRLARHVTVLVIAHRSASIEAADRVLRLEGGAITVRERRGPPPDADRGRLP